MADSPNEPDATGAYVPVSPPAPAERFAPGALLAGRYRVVAALGKGGMGEVYRADDLTLGQPVALKFLPAHIATDPDRLSRFRKEVAAARRVSHPNVCRVYDITEHEGQSFLTMEFVDGEDLSSVLKRLGRVPEEKGIEMARQMCGALAAVHEQGLLHRDVKPANVMLDGRGKIRLTDFGLAAVAIDLSATEVRSGTPLYQAPEQIAGKEVTVRSDLYSLGLVLYEMFTGRRPFAEISRDSQPSKPSSHVSNLNVDVEAVILKCLASDPAARPRSAYEVLAKLPGGDPLAAAVAAGETPSPRVVADAAADDAGLPTWVAALLVAVVIGGVLLSGWLGRFASLPARMPLAGAEPALMQFKAREVLKTLGHDEPADDSVLHYYSDKQFVEFVQKIEAPSGAWDSRFAGLGDGRPPAMVALYRTSRTPMAATFYRVGGSDSAQFGPLNPPPLEPGMADVTLDLRGRLVRFHKVADFLAAEESGPVPPPDWQPAFAAAGLDFDAFAARPVLPRHQPPLAAEARLAWVGPYSSDLVNEVRVEAASLHGKPVYFAVEFPWQSGNQATAYPTYDYPHLGTGVLIFIFGLPLLAAGLAWWNWRAGRADLVGAAKIAGLTFFLWFLRWVFNTHHLADSFEVLLLIQGLGLGAFHAGTLAVFYLALEPVIRKRWPWRLVGWNRLLAGRVRDPLVGRDILIGVAAGVGFTLIVLHVVLGPAWSPELFLVRAPGDHELSIAYSSLNPLTMGIRVGLSAYFMYFLVHWAIGHRWLGIAVFAAAFTALMLVGQSVPKPVTDVLTLILVAVGLALLARQYGLLAFVAATVTYGWLFVNDWTLDFKSWYAAGPAAGIIILLLVALWSACTATEGRILGRSQEGES